MAVVVEVVIAEIAEAVLIVLAVLVVAAGVRSTEMMNHNGAIFLALLSESQCCEMLSWFAAKSIDSTRCLQHSLCNCPFCFKQHVPSARMGIVHFFLSKLLLTRRKGACFQSRIDPFVQVSFPSVEPRGGRSAVRLAKGRWPTQIRKLSPTDWFSTWAPAETRQVL